MKVAIDGPSGAGKSTLARMAAKKLGYLYVDTGALYRCIALYAIQNNVETKDSLAVCKMLPKICVDLNYDKDGFQHMLLNGTDVTDDIRRPEVSMAASDVSSIPDVRKFLLDLQREIADKNNIVMDGRDIGTVVLPDAEVKIFLTASPEVRAERRYRELTEKGFDVSYTDVLNDIKARDIQDINREISPLKAADDAITLDTSNYSLEESLKLIIGIIRG